MKVAYVIACLFGQLVTFYRNNSRILPDEHQPDFADRGIETLALDLFPATAKSRQSFLYSKVLRVTTEYYNRMNLNERADEEEEDEYGSDLFIGAEEDAESEEMDEEIVVL